MEGPVLKSKTDKYCCARGLWFGPHPSGIYSRLNGKNSHNIESNNNNNNNKSNNNLYFSRVALDSIKY